MSTGETGVMVLAAWREDGALRVRLTAADDLGAPVRPVGVAGTVDDACEAVRRWLEDRAG
ncbi:hypothetical protein Acsp06_15400 [Actinomycetospora sp. NBRC 106375]|nr:hypothetical protein Acsp06_15400 [Actinomycetospora sp. NBRC 106375]